MCICFENCDKGASCAGAVKDDDWEEWMGGGKMEHISFEGEAVVG